MHTTKNPGARRPAASVLCPSRWWKAREPGPERHLQTLRPGSTPDTALCGNSQCSTQRSVTPGWAEQKIHKTSCKTPQASAKVTQNLNRFNQTKFETLAAGSSGRKPTQTPEGTKSKGSPGPPPKSVKQFGLSNTSQTTTLRKRRIEFSVFSQRWWKHFNTMDILKLVTSSAPQKKTRGESRLKQQQRRKAAGVPDQQIVDVYEYWCQIMRPGRSRVPALDEKRRLKVASAIADYGVDDCKLAIDGCARSDFHMGRNKQKKRYDDLELILRDQDHIERFLSYVQDEGVDW